MRIAVREGHVAAATFRALGADPIELPAGSALTSVDGAELSLELLRDNPTVRDVRALAANIVLWPKPITIVMNAKRFASLTGRQRDALHGAGAASITAQIELASQHDDEAGRALCRIGTPFVRARPDQLAALRASVQPVYREIERGAGNAATLRQIEAMKGDLAPDAPRCGSPTRSGATTTRGHATPIDGIYRTSFSKQELARSPYLMDAGEINDRNWGVETLHLSEGGVTLTGQNPLATGRSTGRYTVSGNTIRLRFDEIDETFAFRWNLYRDTLRFERDEKLGPGPTPFLVAPWRRIGP